MKKLTLLLMLAGSAFAAAPTCTAPLGIAIYDTAIYSINGLMTGTIDLTLGYTTANGGFTVQQSVGRVAVTAGVLSKCVAPGTYRADYIVPRGGGLTGNTTFTRYWTVATSGGPYDIADIECTVTTTGCVTVPTLAIAAGPTGATGATGPTGATGATGATGPAPSGTGIVAVSAGVLTSPRTITAGSAKLSITNGDGATGNPTIDIGTLTNGTNGQALTSNGSGGFGTAVTLATVATSGSASDLTVGTVAAARGGAGTLSGLLKANGAGVVSASVAGTDYAVATNGTNAQFLTSNGAGGFSTAVSSTGSGSVVLATSPSLTTPDLGTPSVLVLTNATGLPAAAMPGLTGDVTSSAGSVATTVVKINGTTLSGLATGLLKNTTTTGVPSIAVAGTDYSVATNGTLGQVLTSNAAGGFSTALTLAAVATSGSASDLGSGTLAAARMPALTGDCTTSVGTVSVACGAAIGKTATALSQFAATTSAQLAGVISDETGSGAAVFGTSPTLTTPALGTPSALVLTNATGLPATAMPALTGDVTSSAGSAVTSVVRINGTTLSGLATGILKNTTATGVPSIAVAGTDYSVATNGTNGQALTSNGTGGFGTAVTLATVATSGSASDLTAGTLAAARGGAGTLTGILKANGAGVVSAATAGTDYSVATNGTIGQALTSNGTGGFSTALTLATVATSGSASDLGSGTLSAARLPALTGDATSSVGSAATTVVGINGIALSGLATGLLKNTTTTGVPSIAVAGTDYSVATNGTVGQALTSNGTGGFGTALTLATVATSGSASDLSAGTLAAARMPALTGDVTTTVGTVATTVSKINGTTLSGLATGLLKNTTATGVPSIAVAGTDLIGGVGNLTTVGSVPYVSASGILNQDAGQFFWDATNNRLGIGTATPDRSLEVKSALYGGIAVTTATVSDIIGFTLKSTAAGGQDWRLEQGRIGAGILNFFNGSTGGTPLTILANGNVGIGTTAPVYKLDLATSGASGTARFYDQTATTGTTTATVRAGAGQVANTLFSLATSADVKLLTAQATAATVRVYNTGTYGWSSTTASDSGTYDTCIGRAAAALIEITTCTVNAYRDLLLRTTYFGGTGANTSANLSNFGNALMTRNGASGSPVVANLTACSASGQGAWTFVTDALAPAVGVTVAAGGAAKAMVWCNGAAWTVIGI